MMKKTRISRLTLWLLCIWIFFNGCKSGGSEKDLQVIAPDFFPSVFEVMETYDSSFRSLFEKHVRQSGPDNDQLTLLYNVYQNYSLWAKILQDGRMISLNNGKSSLILAIYEPDHPDLKVSGATLVTTHNGENAIIQIRPHRVSKDFAGILLLHELSHALDFINKTHTESSAGNETKAYFHEKKGANIAYGGALDKALDKILDALKPKDVSDLIRLWESNTGRPYIQDLLIGIEKTIGIRPPASLAEAEMRLGFYNIALELRRQENQNAGKAEYSISADKVEQLIKATTKY